MQKYGAGSILTTKIFPKRESIKNSLIAYYESTEEFEKCKYIMDFFAKLEAEYQTQSTQTSESKEDKQI